MLWAALHGMSHVTPCTPPHIPVLLCMAYVPFCNGALRRYVQLFHELRIELKHCMPLTIYDTLYHKRDVICWTTFQPPGYSFLFFRVFYHSKKCFVHLNVSFTHVTFGPSLPFMVIEVINRRGVHILLGLSRPLIFW